MYLHSVKKSTSWIPAYITLGIIWGCSFIFIKMGLEFLTPFGVAFVRCFLGALTLLAVARIRGFKLPRNRKAQLHIWVVAIFLNVLPGIFFALAETAVTSVLAGIVNAVTPLMTLIAILLVNREEKAKTFQVMGLLIGFLGVLTVLGAWKGFGDNPLWAILVLLSAVACYGISFPYTRKYVMPLGIQPESIVSMQLVLATLTLLPLFLLNGVSSYSPDTDALLAMIALGVFGSGFAYLWNFKVMELAGSAIASSVTYLTPVVAIIVGVIFLNEKLTWNEPVGALIVLLGAAIAQERLKPKR